MLCKDRLARTLSVMIKSSRQLCDDRPHPGPLPQERETIETPLMNSKANMVNPVAATPTKRGNKFSLSPGERVGVRASVKLLCIIYSNALGPVGAVTVFSAGLGFVGFVPRNV